VPPPANSIFTRATSEEVLEITMAVGSPSEPPATEGSAERIGPLEDDPEDEPEGDPEDDL
jgi:hypothetical protein